MHVIVGRCLNDLLDDLIGDGSLHGVILIGWHTQCFEEVPKALWTVNIDLLAGLIGPVVEGV